MNSEMIAQLTLALTGLIAVLLIVLVVAVRKIASLLESVLDKLAPKTETNVASRNVGNSEITDEELAAVLAAIANLVPKDKKTAIHLRAVK
jgi:Na+-transporting methylmalonyl-CoA/oxaloacetate decarboxylase gamma subunit